MAMHGGHELIEIVAALVLTVGGAAIVARGWLIRGRGDRGAGGAPLSADRPGTGRSTDGLVVVLSGAAAAIHLAAGPEHVEALGDVGLGFYWAALLQGGCAVAWVVAGRSSRLAVFAIALNAVLIAVSYMVLLERKVIAWVQSRLGPMRVGPYGILQPVADAVKLMIKEDITPVRADRWVFTAAPIISMVPALIVYAVIPFGPKITLFGRQVALYITDINVGLLYIVSVASVGVYGIILAGYASNSKFPLLASLRASAQLISYEVAVTLTLVSVILMSGTLSMVGIVDAQYNQHVWYIVAQPIAFVLVLIGGLAETNRAPFDLPEAEQELTGGFHTEYSGMRFALFFLAEYANMIVVSSVVTTLFLGGWLPPFPNTAALHFLYAIPSWVWFFLKSFCFLYLFIWVRATLPRYRYDQLMALGWKFLIPLAIVNLVVTGIVKVLMR